MLCANDCQMVLRSIQECIPVGCVPPAHWVHLIVSARGGMHAWGGMCVRGGACLEGMHTQGEGACMPKGAGGGKHTLRGMCAWGACVPGGVCMPGGNMCDWGTCMPSTPPLWTDRHLWKHNLCKFRLRAVKITPQCTAPQRVPICFDAPSPSVTVAV